MTVDLSRSIRGLLDGALRRARASAGADQPVQAAKGYDEAARLTLQYSEYAATPSEKKRRLEAAAEYRAHAEQFRSAPPARQSGPGPSQQAEEPESGFEDEVVRLIHKSTVSWDDIAGLEDTKRSIKSAYALSLAQAPEGVVLTPVRNILFHGPPGCGKSLLAAATSNGLDATFFNVKVSSLLSKYFGESPKLVSAVYDAARCRAPSVIFLDEVDALAASRDSNDSGPERRVLANLLSELDGVADKGTDRFVLTIAATNTPWSLDAAIVSRFERQVYIPLPDLAARRRILELTLTEDGHGVEMALDEVAELTGGMSGREMERFAKRLVESMISDMNPDLADVAAKGRESAKNYRLKIRPLTRSDIQDVLSQMPPQTSIESLARYEQWGNRS